VRRAARPSHTEMNTRSKRRLEALSRRYPGKLELRAPQGATPVNLRMQALTAARFDDIYSCRITSNWKTAAVITVITAVITIQL